MVSDNGVCEVAVVGLGIRRVSVKGVEQTFYVCLGSVDTSIRQAVSVVVVERRSSNCTTTLPGRLEG